MTKRKPEAVFFDSNAFINSFRSPEYSVRIERFLQGAYHFEVSKVVLMELWAGVRTAFEESVLKELQRSYPLMGFADDGFIVAGQLLRKMSQKRQLEPVARRRLTWDILIALSARQRNALLITENTADFSRLQSYIDFQFTSVSRQ